MSHVLHCGDGIAGMAAMGPQSVAHIVSDPPYEAEAHTMQRRVKRAPGSGLNGGAYNGNAAETRMEPLPFAPISREGRDAFAREAARLVQRWVVVFCQAEAVADWRDALNAAGLVYRRACVWVKPDAQPQLSGDRPGMGYESIVCAHRAGRSRWNGGGKVGVYVVNKNEAEAHEHPTQKPVALMDALLQDFTDAGDLVCDPYSGASTTGVACKRLGRRFIGWEIDPGFYEVGKKRLDAAREQFQLPRMPRPRQLPLSGPDNSGEAA